MPRVTIACPVTMISYANQLARCIGLGPDDDKTYGDASWRDANGNSYAVASALVSDTFIPVATSPLEEPEWGCDIEAAKYAQSKVKIGGSASPDHIVAVFEDEPLAAIIVLGVFPKATSTEGD